VKVSSLGMRRTETKENIKRAARLLFATRGFANVAVREIVAAAGQKNGGSLHYYFASKENLLEEILIDGAKIWDVDRNRRIDALEAAGGPSTLRELVAATFNPNAEQDDAAIYYTLFRSAMTDERDLYRRVIEHSFDSGFRRAVAHIRRMLPNIPWPLLAERLQFAVLYATATLSTRAKLGHDDEYWTRFWSMSSAEETLFDTIEGMLCQPPSNAALAALRKRKKVTRAPASARTSGEASLSRGKHSLPIE
jgi:AcrR family transcriptional regulator